MGVRMQKGFSAFPFLYPLGKKAEQHARDSAREGRAQLRLLRFNADVYMNFRYDI